MQSSIVIPVYNGERTIRPLVDRLIDELGSDSLEIVLVNDGSRDDSDLVCRSLQAERPETIVYLELARNFGEHNAVMTGLRHAKGDYVVIMDDDFQNPPEAVPRLIRHASNHDYDVVYTYYPVKAHSWLRNLGSRFNDACATLLLDKPRGLYLSSFKCLSRFAVQEVIRYTGPYPYVDGLVLKTTRNIGKIEVHHAPRAEGKSNYTIGRLIALWLRVVLNFSVMPLRLGVLVGFLCSLLGLGLGVLMVLERILRPDLPVGWTSVIVAVLVLAGAQLMMLGLLGEYLGRLYLTANQTPQSVVRHIYPREGRPCASRPTSAASVAVES